MLLLVPWICVQAMQLVLLVQAVRQPVPGAGRIQHGVLMLSGAASIPPLMTLMLYVRVFIIGGASNVAQLTGEGSFPLWSLWLEAWLTLYFGNALAVLMTVVAVLLPPYPPLHARSFASRAAAVISAAVAWYVVTTLFPDA